MPHVCIIANASITIAGETTSFLVVGQVPLFAKVAAIMDAAVEVVDSEQHWK
tara:strand:+ start:2893 stop:3048 length:156 start_codon:yes stop_codon:yes gene_type:complete